jgi:hypothetical protein
MRSLDVGVTKMHAIRYYTMLVVVLFSRRASSMPTLPVGVLCWRLAYDSAASLVYIHPPTLGHRIHWGTTTLRLLLTILMLFRSWSRLSAMS